MRPGFLMGLLVGVAGLWAFHRFVSPIQGKAG